MTSKRAHSNVMRSRMCSFTGGFLSDDDAWRGTYAPSEHDGWECKPPDEHDKVSGQDVNVLLDSGSGLVVGPSGRRLTRTRDIARR